MAAVIDKPPKTMPLHPDRPLPAQTEVWRPLYRQQCRCVHLRIHARHVIGAITQAVHRQRAAANPR
jgi:hypothetical protein